MAFTNNVVIVRHGLMACEGGYVTVLCLHADKVTRQKQLIK